MTTPCALLVTGLLLIIAWAAAVSEKPQVLNAHRLEAVASDQPYLGETTMTLVDAADTATIVTTIAAIVGAVIAIVTLINAGKHINQQLESTRLQQYASLLLQIDERWEGQDLKEPREAFITLMAEAKAEVERQSSQGTQQTKEHKLRQTINCKLSLLEKSEKDGDYQKYAAIFRLCGFFETVGYAARKKYVDERDIIDLFYGAIVYVDNYTRGHIEAIRQEEGQQTQYDNFLYLADQARIKPPAPAERPGPPAGSGHG